VLHYKKLDVYQCAIEFLVLVTEMIEVIPRGHSSLVHQLDDATMSIVLNIAEAVGKTTAPDQAKFFAISRGSAMECGAILEVCEIRNLIDSTRTKRGEELLVRLVQMLTKLSRS
jgi:four helix bundle protein